MPKNTVKRLKPRFDEYLYHSSIVNKRFILKIFGSWTPASKNGHWTVSSIFRAEMRRFAGPDLKYRPLDD